MKTYKLQADCIVVQGYCRAVLCDINQRQVYCIDSAVARILQKDVFTEFELRSIPGDVQRVLFDKEMVFECPAPMASLFPSISHQFDLPYCIEDAVIDYSSALMHNMQDIVNQLYELSCRCVQIRFLSSARIDEIMNVLHLFRNSDINSIEVVADYSTLKDHHIENECNALVSIVAYGAGKSGVEHRNGCSIILVSQSFAGAAQCGAVSPQLFNCNRALFFCSCSHNSCLYRKLSIDCEGYIRNCPASPQHFGRVGEVSLSEAMAHPDFSRQWGITKDQVDVCRDCEFRRICPDCRVFTRQPERPTAHPARCTYNPTSLAGRGSQASCPWSSAARSPRRASCPMPSG